MRDELLVGCKRFVRNLEAVKSVFSWDSITTSACCALMLTLKKTDADISRMSAIHTLLKRKTDLFTDFRALMKAPICASLYSSQDSEQMLQNTIDVYNMYKNVFPEECEYLPLSAVITVQMGRQEDYKLIVNRTKILFDAVKIIHSSLDSTESCAFCSLLALCSRTNEELVKDMEKCEHLMNGTPFSLRTKQILSFILALYEEEPEFKVDQTFTIYNELIKSNHHFGMDTELTVLSSLAVSGKKTYEMIKEICEVDDWLSEQPGFGFLSGISLIHRRMYAAVLSLEITDYYTRYNRPNIISSMIAVQAVVFTAVSAAAAEEDAANSIDI